MHDIHLVRKTQHLSNLFDPRPRADRHLLDGNAKKTYQIAAKPVLVIILLNI